MKFQTIYINNKNRLVLSKCERFTLRNSKGLVLSGAEGLVLSECEGFTLLEVLITIALLVTILSISFFLDPNTKNKEKINTERDFLINVIDKARSNAMNNINNNKHGIYYINKDPYYRIFEGDSYLNKENEILIYRPSILNKTNNNIEMKTDNGDIMEIVFENLSGNVVKDYNIIINDGIQIKTIIVKENGLIIW